MRENVAVLDSLHDRFPAAPSRGVRSARAIESHTVEKGVLNLRSLVGSSLLFFVLNSAGPYSFS